MPMTDVPSRLGAALSDRYRLDGELGQGSMATVYLAEDLRHDRKVAIKVLRAELAKSLGRERFLREIRFAARLDHPNVLPLYDSGEAAGCLYLVMPVMEGETLRTRLDRGEPMPVEEAVSIAIEVAEALDYAHRQVVVHRDIKPENIMLRDGHAIVTDFGIAKALVIATADSAASTRVSGPGGTPAYWSPEQASGEEIDGRSDLFALGCVLFEMLTGEAAFTGPTVQAVIADHAVRVPPNVTEVRSSVPEAVSATVVSLLEKRPRARPATGGLVVEALRALDAPAASP